MYICTCWFCIVYINNDNHPLTCDCSSRNMNENNTFWKMNKHLLKCTSWSFFYCYQIIKFCPVRSLNKQVLYTGKSAIKDIGELADNHTISSICIYQTWCNQNFITTPKEWIIQGLANFVQPMYPVTNEKSSLIYSRAPGQTITFRTFIT